MQTGQRCLFFHHGFTSFSTSASRKFVHQWTRGEPSKKTHGRRNLFKPEWAESSPDTTNVTAIAYMDPQSTTPGRFEGRPAEADSSCRESAAASSPRARARCLLRQVSPWLPLDAEETGATIGATSERGLRGSPRGEGSLPGVGRPLPAATSKWSL